MEQRRLLATYLVQSTADDGSDGTLRWAITQAEKDTAPDTITFSITGAGVQTIRLTAPLPTLTQPTTIDATTQLNYNGTPLVELSGQDLAAGTDGLTLSAGGSTIRGLAINGFSGSAIVLTGGDGNTITANRIGTDALGSIARPNGTGITILASSGNTIGGLWGQDGNLISGNLDNGITIASAQGSSGNQIVGNLIGTDVTGRVALPNRLNGILVDHGAGNTIGGVLPGLGNLISGNTGRGIVIQANLGESSANLIAGNRVGTTIDGSVALGNGSDGIAISGASGTLVGGQTPGAGNLISGNKGQGLSLLAGTTLTTVRGNLIGTRFDGLAPLGNAADGIHIVDSPSNLIGGTIPGSMNVISANAGNGIYIGGLSDLQKIQGNAIGTDRLGVLKLGNLSNGVFVETSANMIGGVEPGAANLIAFNGTGIIGGGVQLGPSAQRNSMLSNSMFGNHYLAISLGNQPTINDDQDADTGPNGLQNYPVLSTAQTDGLTTKVEGRLNSTPNASFTLQFFSTPTAAEIAATGPSMTLVGTLVVATNAQGVATFSVPSFAAARGSLLSATATDAYGNTSEFSQTVLIQSVADVSVSISSTPEPAHVGEFLTYSVTITNHSSVIATGVSLTSQLPSGVLFQTANASQGVFSLLGGNTFFASLGSLAGQSSATLTIIVRPNVGSDVAGSLINSVKVTTQSTDPNSSNNTDSVTSTVKAAANLSLSVATSQAQVPILGTTTYKFTVGNQGPSTAHGVVLHLPFDVSMSLVSVSPNLAMTVRTDGSIDLAMGDFLVGASQDVSIVFKALSLSGLNVSVSVSAVEDDLKPENNAVSASTTVTPASDLAVSIVPSMTTGYRGRDLTYTVTVGNVGPCDANGVNFTQTLPTGAGFVSVTSESSVTSVINGGVLTAVIGSLPAGGSVSFTIVVRPDSNTPDSIETSASVTSTSDEVDSSNNQASLKTPIINASDLVVSVDTGYSSPRVGDVVTLTVTVTNQGPSDDANVQLSTLLHAGLTFVSASSSQGGTPVFQSGQLLANLGLLTSGGSATITILVTPTISLLDGLESTATVKGAALELDSTNNFSVFDLHVAPVNLAVSGLSSKEAVLTGDSLSWNFRVQNLGTTSATGVRLTIPIPASLRLLSVVGSSVATTVAGQNLTVVLGEIQAGETASLTLHLLAVHVGTASTLVRTTADEYNIDPNGGTTSLPSVVQEPPGTFQFSTAAQLVEVSAGAATFVVTRTGGASGTVSVNYQTIAETATAGRDYYPVSGTLVFLPGQISQTIVVPILGVPHRQSYSTVSLILSGVTSGATLGDQASSTLILHDPFPDQVAPQVTDIQLLGGSTSISSVLVSFSELIGADTATDPRAFRLWDLGPDGRLGTGDDQPIAIAGLSYDASRNAVTIIPASPLPAGRFFGVEVAGSGPGAIHDVAGNPLDGSGYGVAGTAYTGLFGRGANLKYTDSAGNTVNLRLRGPGYIDQIRSASGDGVSLDLGGVISGRSTLTGSVKRGRTGSGSTEIGAIGGLGAFGQVRVKLASPAFRVRSYPFSLASRNQPIAMAPVRPKVALAKPKPLVRQVKVHLPR